MKERPILFKGPMIRAILDGKKTQTRRLNGLKHLQDYTAVSKHVTSQTFDFHFPGGVGQVVKCPYGVVGDHLWVREAWCAHARYDGMRPSVLPEIKYLQNGITYMADVYKGEKSTWMGKTRPSIFIPRKHSRITLEITDIRVERVQDISDADVLREGAKKIDGDNEWGGADLYYSFSRPKMYGYPKDAFADLWDSINVKKYPWVSNPWVWCVSFKVIK